MTELTSLDIHQVHIDEDVVIGKSVPHCSEYYNLRALYDTG